MSVAALLHDPKALGEKLRQFVSSKEDFEEGLSAHSYTNGLLTAVIVGPEEIPAAEWMARIVDPTQGQIDDEDAKLSMAMMLFEHSQIVKSLRSRDSSYEPMFWEDGDGRLITKDWAYGFLAGVRLREEAWEPLREGKGKVFAALLSVLLQSEEIDAALVDAGGDPREVFETAKAGIADWIYALYSIRREKAWDTQHQEKKVGRNDPCPCGSGKKYKKCCLN
jgi:uncharacterized protein